MVVGYSKYTLHAARDRPVRRTRGEIGRFAEVVRPRTGERRDTVANVPMAGSCSERESRAAVRVIKCAGTANDREPMLTAAGGTTPNNARAQQVP